jgi:hypothetical protein
VSAASVVAFFAGVAVLIVGAIIWLQQPPAPDPAEDPDEEPAIDDY